MNTSALNFSQIKCTLYLGSGAKFEKKIEVFILKLRVYLVCFGRQVGLLEIDGAEKG